MRVRWWRSSGLRLGKIDADEYPWLPRQTHQRHLSGSGTDIAQLDGDALARLRREHFGFIFQRYHLLSHLTAAQNVEVPAVYAGSERRARLARAHELLVRLGWASAPTINRHSCPAVSSSGSVSPAP